MPKGAVTVLFGTPMHSQALLTSHLPSQTSVTEGGSPVVVVVRSSAAVDVTSSSPPFSVGLPLTFPPRRLGVTVAVLSSVVVSVRERVEVRSSPERVEVVLMPDELVAV